MKNYIENWKLCDYTYCPQIVNHLISQEISIQEPREDFILHLDSFLDSKKAASILQIVDLHRDAIEKCQGIKGNSVYLLLNYGLSRPMIRDYIFEKIELEQLLFLSLNEITKLLDLSVYTGHKIMEACRFALHLCVDNKDEKKMRVLLDDIRDYFRGTKEPVSIETIEQ